MTVISAVYYNIDVSKHIYEPLKKELAMPYETEVGMDIHKMYSMFGVVKCDGNVVSYDKVSNDTRLFDRFFSRFAEGTFRVTLEATRGISWVIDYFDRKNIPYIVSNPFLNRAIANVHCKNDKYDARTLADLARSNYIARCYVPTKPIRELRDLIAHRAKLVVITTKLKNKVHDVLAKYNYVQPISDIFGVSGIQWVRNQKLSDMHKQILEETLALIGAFLPRTMALEKTIKEKVHEHRYFRLLQTVPGIGPINAATIIARVEDINRFPNVTKFIRYAGLSVNTRESAEKMYLGKLNKKSDKFLRTAFVDAEIAAVQKDPGLSMFYQYLLARKGKGIARVAVARKLARSVYFMLRKSQPYHYRQLQNIWSNTTADKG